jgi:hypothetical protein
VKHGRTRVFVSYSHRDQQWLERLQVHLVPLSGVYRIEIWDDSRIAPGSKWRSEIQDALDSTLAAVLLVSACHLRDIGYIEVPSVRLIPRSGANLSEHVVFTATRRQFL